MNQTTEKRVSPRKAAAKAAVEQAATKVAEKKAAAKPRKAVAMKAEPPNVETKAVAKKASPLAVTAGVVQKFFVFVEGARPTSGPRLAAHTNAALSFLGMDTKKPAKKNAVLAVLGVRAVKYHKDIGNLEEKADNLQLTAKGLAFFTERVKAGKVDSNLSAAFHAAIAKGKLDKDAGIKENHLIPVGMALR